jgi:hypothetical protein
MKAGDPWTESLTCSKCGLSGSARLSQSTGQSIGGPLI